MKPFDKTDWYGFAGAEEDSERPALIGHTEKYIIVADINGLSLYSADMDETWGQKLNYYIAVHIAVLLESNYKLITPEELQKMGFTRY